MNLAEKNSSFSSQGKKISLFVVNRSSDHPVEAEISLVSGTFKGLAKISVVNGKDIHAVNTFDNPENVTTVKSALPVQGRTTMMAFEPHSVTCLVAELV